MLIREIPCPLPPEELFRRLSHRRGCFFLDHARAEDGFEGFTYLGFEPFLSLEASDRNITLTAADGSRESFPGDPLDALRTLLRRYRPAANGPSPFPFTGGAVGGLSYELCARLDRISRTAPDDLGLPDLRFGFQDGFFAFAPSSGRAWLVANPVGTRSEAEIVAWLEQALKDALTQPAAVASPPGNRVEPQANLSKSEYLRAIGRIKDYITAGDVYQVNLTQRFAASLTIPPSELYLRLRRQSPAPHAGYFDFGSWQVVGSSPERFLRIRDGLVETRPIKGTRPRGLTPGEDSRLRAELLSSEKDRAELLMIVDLERNDLGRVCEFGSVRVENLHQVEAHPTVFHLVADVSGRLRPGLDVIDCLRATFPGGSITGAPKIRAMQIIDELEPHRRHFYTGSFGYVGFDGNCDLNIAIRTIFCTGGRAYYHVGGGIVSDSDPAAEYQETLDKGRAMRAALAGEPVTATPAAGYGVFETIKVTQGRPVFLSAHCARLFRGMEALALTLQDNPAELPLRCTAALAASPGNDGVLTVTVQATPGGAVELISLGERRYTPEHWTRGFALRTVPWPAPPGPDAGLKTLRSREAWLAARDKARAAGCDEALLIDSNSAILEGSISNVFVVRGGHVFTPPLSAGILPGVIRALLLRDRGRLLIEETDLPASILRVADEVFLTNSLLGVMPVARIDGREFDLRANPVTRAFHAAYQRLEAADLAGRGQPAAAK